MTSVWHWSDNSVNNVVNKLIIPNGKRMLKGYKLFSPHGEPEPSIQFFSESSNILTFPVFQKLSYTSSSDKHGTHTVWIICAVLPKGQDIGWKRLTSVNTRIVPTLKYLGFFPRNGPMWPRNSLCGFKAHFKSGMDSFHHSLHENGPLFVKTETLQ